MLARMPGPYPRVQALCRFDTKAFLDVLTVLFDEEVAAAYFAASNEGGGRPGDKAAETDLQMATMRPTGAARGLTLQV